MAQPISSYLVTATVGKFSLRTGRTGDGVPYVIAVDPREQVKAAPALKKLPAIVDFFSRKYGAYPFGQTGAIVDDAPFVGYALETATARSSTARPASTPWPTSSPTSGTATP